MMQRHISQMVPTTRKPLPEACRGDSDPSCPHNQIESVRQISLLTWIDFPPFF